MLWWPASARSRRNGRFKRTMCGIALGKRPRRARNGASDEVELDEEIVNLQLPYRARQHERCLQLKHTAMKRFKADVRALRACGGDSSFFLSSDAARRILSQKRPPAVLAYVSHLLLAQLAEARERGVSLPARRCGAEWWVQRRRRGDGLNFHWDKDETLRDETEFVIHPYVSSVTYLTTGGAPTLLLDVRVDSQGELALPEDTVNTLPTKGTQPRRRTKTPQRDSAEFVNRATAEREMTVDCLASYPLEGKLLLFNGRLLHGCPAEIESPSQSSEARLTLLVNVWIGHRPVGMRPLPASVARRLRCRDSIPSRSRVQSADSATRTPLNSEAAQNQQSTDTKTGEDRLASSISATESPSLLFRTPSEECKTQQAATVRIPVCGTHELVAALPFKGKSTQLSTKSAAAIATHAGDGHLGGGNGRPAPVLLRGESSFFARVPLNVLELE